MLAGLSLSYTARFSWVFNRTSSVVTNFTPIAGCAGRSCSDSIDSRTTGSRNAWASFVHGPTVQFQPHPKVTVAAAFQWIYLPKVDLTIPAVHADSLALQAQQTTAPYTLDLTSFDLSGSWQVTKPMSLTFGLSTYSPQVGTGGYYLFPLVNRDTTVYLDATFDINATVNAFL